jgi:hypothetical protein
LLLDYVLDLIFWPLSEKADGNYHHGANINDLKQLKAGFLEEDATYDKLRSLPL